MNDTDNQFTVMALVTDPMTDAERDIWLADTACLLTSRVTTKFIAGRIEHGCDLGTVSIIDLLDHVEQEALDQLMYVRELKRRYGKQELKKTEADDSTCGQGIIPGKQDRDIGHQPKPPTAHSVNGLS